MVGELENSLQAVFVPHFDPSSVSAALLHPSWLIPLPLNFAVTEITPVCLNVITQHIAVSSIFTCEINFLWCPQLSPRLG